MARPDAALHDGPEVRLDGTVVVGLGGIGSAAAFHLASRGHRVVGFEPRGPGHTDGSSHGRTRLVRQAYFEEAAYVPLAGRAWRLWHDLQALSGDRLLTESGVLALARRQDPAGLVAATLTAARRHGLDVEHLDAAAVRDRFPAVTVPDDWEGAFERAAGFVDPQATVEAHTRLALAAGAEVRREPVLRIDPDGPTVWTATARWRPQRVVVTAGPWAPRLLGHRLPVVARRKVLAHFTPLDVAALGPEVMPGFVIGSGDGLFYGFPALDGQGVKIGRHDGGEATTPGTVDRRVRPAEVAELRAVLDRFLPAASGPVQQALTCLYTMSPDGHFLVGALPGAPQVLVATGCSGHAFKFVPALGEVLADLATGRSPAVDVGFLDPARFATAD